MQDTMAQLSNTIDAFIGYIQQLPAAALSPSPTTQWGPKEVLIHIVFWHEKYCAILRALLDDEPPELVHGTLKRQNALAVAQYSGEAIDHLLRRLRTANRQLEGLCGDPRAKSVRMTVKVDGKARLLERVQKL